MGSVINIVLFCGGLEEPATDVSVSVSSKFIPSRQFRINTIQWRGGVDENLHFNQVLKLIKSFGLEKLL